MHRKEPFTQLTPRDRASIAPRPVQPGPLLLVVFGQCSIARQAGTGNRQACAPDPLRRYDVPHREGAGLSTAEKVRRLTRSAPPYLRGLQLSFAPITSDLILESDELHHPVIQRKTTLLGGNLSRISQSKWHGHLLLLVGFFSNILFVESKRRSCNLRCNQDVLHAKTFSGTGLRCTVV